MFHLWLDHSITVFEIIPWILVYFCLGVRSIFRFMCKWPIENIWGIMKEKTRGKTFENLDSLVGFVNSEWRKITLEQRGAMIDNIPKRLAKMVQLNGNQVYEH